jgi:5-methylcytosine-specific restriction protein A
MKLHTLKTSLSRAPGLRVAPAPAGTERMRGSALMSRRLAWFTKNPLCVECDKSGRTEAATQLDHVTPLWAGGSDAAPNLQGLCEPCHKAKTAGEAADRLGSGARR